MELILIYVAVPGRAQRVGTDVSVQLWLRGERVGVAATLRACLHPERCLRPDTLAGSIPDHELPSCALPTGGSGRGKKGTLATPCLVFS